MLKITVPATELWDNEREVFIKTKEQTLALEHSLVSVSKWEAKWEKPFLTNKEKSAEEIIDYIRCMTLTQNVDPMVYKSLTSDNFNAVREYIDAPMTATTFSNNGPAGHRETVTSELIYYWMIALNIPVEFQKWHLNRLITLIRICNIKNSPQKKMSKAQTASQYRALNEARRKANHSKG